MFKSILTSFLGVDESNIGIYMIHLARATERLEHIKHLEEQLQAVLPIFDAANGEELLKQGYPNDCPYTRGNKRGAGDVGCTVSHYNVSKDGLAKGYEFIVVFEDDCILNRELEELRVYLEEVKKYFKDKTWDIFLLGNSAHLDFYPETNFLVKIRNFYGSHALILNRKAMESIVDIHENGLKEYVVYSADGIYVEAIKKLHLEAYGCIEAQYFFEQKAGIYSYILEGIRK